MEMLGFALKKEALLRSLTADVLKTSEIENEYLDADQVRSSLARRVGIEIGAAAPADGDVEGIAGMMLDATQNYPARLTDDRLFGWYGALFPAGRLACRRSSSAPGGMTHPFAEAAWIDTPSLLPNLASSGRAP